MATNIYWMCPLEKPRNTWQPRLEKLHQDPAIGTFGNRWVTTDGVRAAPWAVGVAIVDDLKVVAFNAAIEADGQIHAFPETIVTTRFNTVTPTSRTRINTFCDAIGVARPGSTEVLRDFCQRLVATIDSVQSIEGLRDAAIAGP